MPAILLFLLSICWADQTRGALAFQVSPVVAPAEPDFHRPASVQPGFSFEMSGWAVFGGKERITRRGRTRVGKHHHRLGLVLGGGLTRTVDLATAHERMLLAVGYGGQWGGRTTYATFYGLVGIGGHGMQSVDPVTKLPLHTVTTGIVARPTLAFGVAPVRGFCFEVGPYVEVLAPLHRAHRNRAPLGRGLPVHAGLALTAAIGSISPRVQR